MSTADGGVSAELVVALYEFLKTVYTAEEFRILVYRCFNKLDLNKVQEGGNFEERVFNFVLRVERDPGPAGVYQLADLALKERGNRSDLAEQVAKIRAELPGGQPASVTGTVSKPGGNGVAGGQGGAGGSSGGKGGGGGGAAAEEPLPPDLARILKIYEAGPAALPSIAREIRGSFRAQPAAYEGLNLHERFHLSDSEAERLVAILALERWPQPRYCWWLGERVTVEPPRLGMFAAQALASVAVWLPQADLPRLRESARRAEERLAALIPAEAALVPAGAPATFTPLPAVSTAAADAACDATARKQVVGIASGFIEMRLLPRKSFMSPAHLEQFCQALDSDLDRSALDQICNTVGFPLKLLARADDPMALCVVYLTYQGRMTQFERDLVAAASTVKAGHPVFDALAKQYPIA